MSQSDSRRQTGDRIRREVLGDAYVDQAAARTTPFSRPFQELVTDVAWGDVWTRPELDRKTRSCLTVALLAALGHDVELATHVRGALRNGLTAADLSAVLLHTALYAGLPAANRAFAVTQRVLDEVAADQNG
jgi:4-carboxymuconolactone decarboxylase